MEITFALFLIAIAVIVIGLSKFFVGLSRQGTYWKNRNVPYMESSVIWKFLLRKWSFNEYCDFVYNSYPNAKYVGSMQYFKPNLLIRDPQLIHDITVKNFDHFMDHKAFLDETVDPVFSKNVFSLRGERWKEMRNILTPSFTASKMRILYELLSECSREFVDCLCERPEYYSSVDAKEMFVRYTSDAIATVAFGIKVNSMKDPGNEFFAKGKDVFDNSFGNTPKLMLAVLFPWLMKTLKITVVPADTTNFFRRIISETLKTREEQGIVRPDMLQLLMQAKNKEDPSSPSMTLDDITSQLFIFFLAGSDSSSNLMAYMLYELALNTHVQERLQQEVDRCFEEGNGKISYETLMKMEYIEMVVSETLRKYPSGVFIDRLCTKEFDFPPSQEGCSATTLYPGETVWFCVYSIQRDPKYFPDPEKFEPERFSSENKDKLVPYSYFPFGAGPRKCIGDRFALMNMKIVMAHLLRRFSVKCTEKTQIPLKFKKNTFTLIPEKGFWIGLEKRAD